jgi:hypothetical protein
MESTLDTKEFVETDQDHFSSLQYSKLFNIRTSILYANDCMVMLLGSDTFASGETFVVTSSWKGQ